MQRADFVELFEIKQAAGDPLLDPPLHEFLPHSEAEIAEVAAAGRRPEEAVQSRPRPARVQPDAISAAVARRSPIRDRRDAGARH
jgi:hypothetical protein